jgi:hypothetical protein
VIPKGDSAHRSTDSRHQKNFPPLAAGRKETTRRDLTGQRSSALATKIGSSNTTPSPVQAAAVPVRPPLDDKAEELVLGLWRDVGSDRLLDPMLLLACVAPLVLLTGTVPTPIPEAVTIAPGSTPLSPPSFDCLPGHFDAPDCAPLLELPTVDRNSWAAPGQPTNQLPPSAHLEAQAPATV